jgi:putative addiction module CopG family antidote
MEVHFTPDQQAFLRQAIESGRLHDEDDAVKEALSLVEERERRLVEILTAVEDAEASLSGGEGRPNAGIDASTGKRGWCGSRQ